MQISNELRTMILRRKPGHTLEAPFYQSREVFDLDVEAIFGRHWIYAGVEPDIPEPGDYFTVPIGRASVFVVRDDDMSIRAFHNVCRHRGRVSATATRAAWAISFARITSGRTTSRASSFSPSTWATISTAASTA